MDNQIVSSPEHMPEASSLIIIYDESFVDHYDSEALTIIISDDDASTDNNMSDHVDDDHENYDDDDDVLMINISDEEVSYIFFLL